MARVRDMRNIKKVEDEQSQNTGNHPHGVTDCDICTSLDSYIENDKTVEEKKDKVSDEISISNKLDYAVLGATIANELENRIDVIENIYGRFGIGGVHGQNYPPKNKSVNENVSDFTIDEDYVHFLESKVAQLQYKLHLLKSGE
jgi:hypothetical protein